MKNPATATVGGFLCALFCASVDIPQVFGSAPANDMFADRIAVTGLPLRLVGDTTEATVEPEEPTEIQPGFGRRLERSVWWSWTATKSGIVGIYFGLDRSRGLRVYVGDSWEELVAVPLALSPDGTGPSRTISFPTDWSFRAEAGTTYQIGVYDAGSFTLDLMGRPLNDFFADRLEVPAVGGTVSGTTTNTTYESDEPIAPSRGVWYSWSPDFSGQAILMLSGGNGTDPLEAFTGDNVAALVGVGASGRGDRVLLPLSVKAGEAYSLRVSGRPGPELFRLSIGSAPTNDDFAEATELSGYSGIVDGTTWGMTVEQGEPFLNNITGATGTAWWKWVAPTNGLLRMKAGDFYRRVAYGLFRGRSLSSLASVKFIGIHAGDGYPDYYTVAGGRTYYLRIQDSPIFHFEFELFRRPANDNFARREVLDGLSGSTTGDNYLASRQRNEPHHGGSRAGHSVWWTWTAPLSGHLFVTTTGSGFANVVASYTGDSLSHLEPVADNRLSYWTGLLGFPVEAEVSYQIAVDGIVETDVDGRLRVTRGSIDLGFDFTTLMFATPTNGSVFVGPTNVTLSLNTPLEMVDGKIASAEFYVPYSAYVLRPVGVADSAPFSMMTPNLVPGIYVCGCSVTNHLGHVRVVPPVVFAVRPPNDDFSESIRLDSIPGTVRGWVGGASWEPREKRPLHVVPNAGSSWWVWTAPETADFRLRVNTLTSFVLYRGSALGALTTVARFHYGEGVFHAVGGETYHLQAYSPAISPSGVTTEVEFTLSR